MEVTTVACVLRSGGHYTPEWVERLRRQVSEHFHAPHRFACLTDVDMDLGGVDTVPLIEEWPGWWSKIELWREDIFDGRVIFFDLDTLIVGDITPLTSYDGPFATLRDFGDPRISASGVMLWDGRQPPPIYGAMPDGGPLRPNARIDLWWNRHTWTPDHLQDLYPGMFGSYKLDGLKDGPRDFPVVYFHGSPTITDFDSGHWVTKAWVN